MKRIKNLGGDKKKMKTKTLVIVEIAIVLCSVFLVATLPGIAAGQNQEMQKVSANTITTTADRPTYKHTDLDVFGNANEDDTIDMRDTTYIKLVIFSKKPETDLADANYDGKVSMLDVGQTKLIILGKEKKLTFIDIFGEAETVNKPIRRLAQLGFCSMSVVRALNAMNILVPICSQSVSAEKMYYQQFSKWPTIGISPPDCDYEKILSLKPDAVQTNLEAKFALPRLERKRMFEENLPGIPIISLNMREQDVLPENVRTYGYIIDKKDEAEEFIGRFKGLMNLFESRTESLSEDEKPRFVMTWFSTPNKIYCSGSRYSITLALAGGKNIADEIVGPGHPNYGHTVEVDPEWIVEQNPEYMFTVVNSNMGGYETAGDPSKMRAVQQEILDRPEFAKVEAVKNKHVYVLPSRLIAGEGHTVIASTYVAKLFHPSLFTDMDPQAIHQEYLDKFCQIDFNVKEHGVFVYPPMEKWTP